MTSTKRRGSFDTMDITTAIIVFLITGIGVGFTSGMLGVGGCFIMTPAQYWIYTTMGISSDLAIKVAFGTSLFVVLPTAISGALGHTKRGVVCWRAGFVLGMTGAAGAIIGSTIAAHLPGRVLVVAFGCVVTATVVRMVTAKPPEVKDTPKDRPLTLAAWGFPLGILSGIIGIGGGVIVIPVMILALNFKMHNAVGTSTAFMIFASLGGILGYIYNGLAAGVVGAYQIGHLVGYVNLESWLALTATSVPMARVGVRTAHRLPGTHLRYIFIVAMLYVGLKMMGVFSYLGLPL